MGMLDGKVALVTGGSRGIGRAISTRLAREGAVVAVHYGANEAAAREVVTEIDAAGGRAFAFGVRLGEPGDARALWAAFDEGIARHAPGAGLDILVNNAGITRYGRIHEVGEAEVDEVLAVNVKAPFFIIKYGLERMRDGGRIINIGSGVTRIAFPKTTAYSMTKAALDVLTHTLALDLGPRGITVNCVAPGIVDTEMNDWLADPEARANAEAFSVFNRIGEPADIADVVAFLASDGARWITGQRIDATGGSMLGIAA